MKTWKLATAVLTVVTLSVAYSLWIISLLSHKPAPVVFGMVTMGVGFIAIWSWIAFSVYVMYRLLHKVDRIANPEHYELIKTKGDLFLMRVHRMSTYTFSSISSWFNRRTFPQYDFRDLPKDLRIPLALNAYWVLVAAVLFFGGGAFI